MRETKFIEQKQRKWQEVEQLLDGQVNDPEKLNELFVQVTDDLSFARTFYPNRSVRVYLNGLAQKIFFNIYKNKKSRRSNFVAFWVEELPRLIHESRHDLRLSFCLFAVAMAIGVLSCWAEPEFLRTILGDGYVQMTEENIKSGDPMAVYKEAGAFNMFLGITMNNLLVAFITFVMGIFYAIGTVGSLLYNGIMLGAFQYFFIEKGLFQVSFLAVWLHGSFEISSIVIAGGAGLTLGRGLVFPGTLSRDRSFQLAARRGMSLMVGVVPLFIFAGFTESYLTRHTDAPDWLRGLFIFTCFAIVAFYFVIFPKMVAKKGPVNEGELRLVPDVEPRVDFTVVKNAGEIFTDAFIFLRKNLQPIGLAALAGTVLYCFGAFLLAEAKPAELFSYQSGLFGTLRTVPSFFYNAGNPLLFPLAVAAIGIVAFFTQMLLARWRWKTQDDVEERGLGTSSGFADTFFSFLKTMVAVTIFSFIFLLPGWATLVFLPFLFPIFFLWTQVVIYEGASIFASISRTVSLLVAQFGQMLGVYLTLLLCGLLTSLLLDTPLLWRLLNVISMNFHFTAEGARVFEAVAFTGIAVFLFLLIIGLWATGSGLQYFSNVEAREAFFLKKRLELIGKRERIRGLEREG